MRVCYYVLARDQQFEVFREDVSKGASPFRSRAVELGRALARLEARYTGVATELRVEAADGRLHVEAAFDRATAPVAGPEPDAPTAPPALGRAG